MELQIKDYIKMIQKKAWDISKISNSPYKEIFSEGLYLFTKYSKKYNYSKAKFSTYFHYCLLKLNSKFCKKNKELNIDLKNFLYSYKGISTDKNYLFDEIIEKSEDKYFKKFIETMEFYDAMDRQLNEDSQKIFRYLQTYISRQPRFCSVQKYFRYIQKWKRKRFLNAWNSLRKWWLEFQAA